MIRIWHNPRCSKSRETLALIEEKGDVAVRKYLEDAPTEAEIRETLDLLGLKPIEMMRPRETAFRDMGLSKTDPDDILIAAMVQEPKLIERPIVFANGKAALGRPPEAVLDLF